MKQKRKKNQRKSLRNRNHLHLDLDCLEEMIHRQMRVLRESIVIIRGLKWE